MNRPLPTLLALGLLALCASAAGADKKKEVPVPFEQFGKEFLERHCEKDATAAKCPLAAVRSQHYVRCVLGAFELAYPVADLADKQQVEDLRSIAKALLEAQVRWIELLAKEDTSAVEAEVATLQEWIKTWKTGSFAGAKHAKEKDLVVLLDANAAQAAAAKGLTEFLLKPASLGIAPKRKEPARILFAPKRREFVELVGYAGLLDSKQQGNLWRPVVGTWTGFWLQWDLVLALEYPAWADDPEFERGLSMNKDDVTGLLQHVVQQAMQGLMWHCFGDGDALYLQQALALGFTIDVCGEANALEGHSGRGTTGAQTQPYEMFVPGGNPAGGTLPAIPAAPFDMVKENQWRVGHGKDRFAGPLRDGQKNGQKRVQKDRPDGLDPALAKDRFAHFELKGDDEVARLAVSAPFLGKAANEKPYPAQNFLIDFKEFFRAYRTCFFHWLRHQGDPAGEAASKEKFRELLLQTASRTAKKSFEEIVAGVYQLPLSGKNGETDSLEWRFLEWLGKGAK